MVALFDVGGTELLLILGAALVLLGPKRLPEIARQLGKVSNQLRDANRELKRELYSNLEPPPAVAARGDEPERGLPAPRPPARHVEQGAAAALPAAATADYDAPYHDAEAEAKRASRPAAAAPEATPPATDPAAATPPAVAPAAALPLAAPQADPPQLPTQEADPDESGSAS